MSEHEALAQVAVLLETIRSLGVHVARENETLDKARALLDRLHDVETDAIEFATQLTQVKDRLQRAEAVVEALRIILSCQDQSGWQTAKGKGHELERGFRLGRRALAAVEERVG